MRPSYEPTCPRIAQVSPASLCDYSVRNFVVPPVRCLRHLDYGIEVVCLCLLPVWFSGFCRSFAFNSTDEEFCLTASLIVVLGGASRLLRPIWGTWSDFVSRSYLPLLDFLEPSSLAFS